MEKNLKIRHYVTGVMRRAGSSSEKIMSATEMAKHFGIARSTVCLALKELTEDGFLFSKPGIGNFTNPHRLYASSPGRSVPKLTGCVIGDGQSYYFHRSGWSSLASLGLEATANNMYFRPVPLSSKKEREILEELLDMKLDALIWVDHMELSEKLAQKIAKEIPFVCDNVLFSGVNVVGYDIVSAWYEIARNFMEIGKRNILVCLYDWHLKHELCFFRKFFKDAGIPLHIKIFSPDAERDHFEERALETLKNNSFDACITHSDYLDFFRAACPPRTEVFEYWCCRTKNGQNLEYTFPHERRAAIMMERIREMWNEDKSIRNIQIPMTKNIRNEERIVE